MDGNTCSKAHIVFPRSASSFHDSERIKLAKESSDLSASFISTSVDGFSGLTSVLDARILSLIAPETASRMAPWTLFASTLCCRVTDEELEVWSKRGANVAI